MSTQLEKDLEKADRIAALMDSAFRIPGTQIKVGWDSVIGLIPGVGDFMTTVPLIYFLVIGWRHNLPKRVLLLMIGRQAVDFLLGSVPIVGDLFDIAYRSNQKNAHAFRNELAKRITQKTP